MCWMREHCGIYKSSYNISNIKYLNSPPPSLFFITPFPHSCNSFNRSHFFHLHTCVHNIWTIFTLPYSFLTSYLLPLVQLPQARPFSPCCSLIFLREKKWHFCLFSTSKQRVSLWHFHMYMYYNWNWFISSIFLFSTLVPFLWWF
jgi:hypothetical protein